MSKRLEKLEQQYRKVRQSRNDILAAELLKDGADFIQSTDEAILSVSENEFVKNKGERLKQLKTSKEEIKTILKNTERDIVSGKMNPIKSPSDNNSALSPFLKTFKSKDVLEKVNPNLARDKTKAIQAKVKKNEKDNSSIKKAQDKTSKDRIKVDINPNDPEYEPIKLNIQEDTSSIHAIAENNEKIYQRLLDMGEIQMANHIHGMMGRVQVGPKYKYASEINTNTNQLRVISGVNNKIEEHLGELRYLLREKQDTEIESVEDRLVQEVKTEEVLAEREEERDSSGFIENLLGMLFGKPLMMLLRAGAGIIGFAKGLLTPVLGWLLSALTTGIKGIFGALFKGPWEMFKSLGNRFNEFLNVTFEGFKQGYTKFKDGVILTGKKMAEKFDKAINGVRGLLDAANARITQMGKSIVDLLKKIPGVSKLVDMLNFGDKSNKLSKAKIGGDASKGFVGKLVDSTKSIASKAGSAIKTGGKAVYAAGSAAVGGAVDWSKGKLASIGKGIASVASKVGSKFSSIPKRLTDHVASTGGKLPTGGIFKKMGKFTKVLRAVPFLGQALAVGFAAKAAHDGWNNAGSLYGIPQNEVSNSGKIASAVGAVVKDLLWPIPINQKTIAMAALSLTRSPFAKGGEIQKGDYSESLGDVDQFAEDVEIESGTESDVEQSDIPFKNIVSLDSAMQMESETDILRFGMPVPIESVSQRFTGANKPGEDFKGFDEQSHPVTAGKLDGSGLMGFVSAKYESAGKGVHTISTGQGDPGGVSYGTYQLASKTGTMKAFLDSSEGKPFREKFKGTPPGSGAFNMLYADVARNNPVEFNEAQHLFIKRTHYDPIASMASGMGIKTNNRSIQEALWSQSVQHGRAGNKKILEGALAIADPNDIPAFLRAIYNSRGKYVSGLKMGAGTRSSILNRYGRELGDVLSLSGAGGSNTIIAEPVAPVKGDPELVDLNRVNLQGMNGSSSAEPVAQAPEKPEDPKEHDPQEDVKNTEDAETPTNLKELQDKYISLYSPWDPDFDGLRKDTKVRFLAMAKEHFEMTGEKIQVNSAFRSMKKQQELYDNKGNNPNPVAKPGGSIHNFGMALDIQSDQVSALRKSGLLAKHGFGEPVRNDPPHIEDITVDRDKIRGVPYSAENMASTAANATSATFGDPYDGEASDYQDTPNTGEEMLKSLGLDVNTIMSEFGKTYEAQTSKSSKSPKQTSTNKVDSPINDKLKIQSNIESTMTETQIADSENSVLSYVNTAMAEMQSQISQVSRSSSQINQTVQTSDSTGSIFAINNDEYTPGQELRY